MYPTDLAKVAKAGASCRVACTRQSWQTRQGGNPPPWRRQTWPIRWQGWTPLAGSTPDPSTGGGPPSLVHI
ncbi:unnamed protein product [Amoebophrya sp. A25]|nr:unnamed protein product [Amoebophrya sp. A25]|eukprot:GSA25T00013690001.1